MDKKRIEDAQACIKKSRAILAGHVRKSDGTPKKLRRRQAKAYNRARGFLAQCGIKF